jgi:hypothetical protein
MIHVFRNAGVAQRLHPEYLAALQPMPAQPCVLVDVVDFACVIARCLIRMGESMQVIGT